LYRMQEQWGKLVSVHEVELRSQADKEQRVLMMHRIAEIAEERANDHALAFAWMQRALMEDATSDHSITEAERLAPIVDGWAQLANTYAAIAEQHPSQEVRVTIGKRVARIYEEELQDVQRAEESYRYVVAMNDRDDDVLVALDRIYTEHG